jgi:hypothetical protein
MENKIIKIKNIEINNNNIIIIDDLDEIYNINIIKGSIKCKIYNLDEEEICLDRLKEENIIKIYSIKNIIKKIIILNNYILSSESSDENIF